jgi:hypothetical protein
LRKTRKFLNIYKKNKKVYELIPVNWYVESPIDFEYKQYLILSYLQNVDSQFICNKLSPHLLHMESMINDMLKFKQSLDGMKKSFQKQKYIYIFNDNPKLEGDDNHLIKEIEEIIEFSVPIIQNRVNLGNIILRKNNQVLF